jgi:protein-S-isoprenylcysteine O-methyltransferase Ste14
MCTVFFVIIKLPDKYLFEAPDWIKWPMYLLQISGMLFGMMSLRELKPSVFFGIRQLKECLKENSSGLPISPINDKSEFNLSRNGVYSIVRHPIYLAGIIMISFQPVITYNRLTVMIIADAYFIYAALKEEYILLRLIKDQYREYMQEVPRFNIFKGVHNRIYRT